MKPAWSLDAIAWSALAPERVDPELLEAVKAAALVEANSADYVRYLHNVFADDPAFREAASYWGVEERQHGDALGRWAEAVDPAFSYEQSLARFRAGYRIPVEARQSVRGSCAGELVARCVVESGTCSFYSAIRDRTAEPVLKQIAGFIAQDEARHYRLFKTHLERYLAHRKLGFFERCRIAYARVAEADDDELAYAYYSANIATLPAPREYERRACARAYSRRTLQLYELKHLRAALHMILNAANINPAGRIAKIGVWLGWRALQFRVRRLQHAGAV